MDDQAAYKQTLIKISRTLTPERSADLLNFARFLQILETQPDALESEEKWDQLFSNPEAQRTLVEMAREAREEFRGWARDRYRRDRRWAPLAKMNSKAPARFWRLYRRLSPDEQVRVRKAYEICSGWVDTTNMRICSSRDGSPTERLCSRSIV